MRCCNSRSHCVKNEDGVILILHSSRREAVINADGLYLLFIFEVVSLLVKVLYILLVFDAVSLFFEDVHKQSSRSYVCICSY